ncbi:sensor histidine kinase, partial [Pseudomonas syringae pv. tagetis]
PFRGAISAPGDTTTLKNANRLLSDITPQTGADVMYLIDANGQTLAASNTDQKDSIIGRNYSFRPYFIDAQAGTTGSFFGHCT